MKKIDLDLKNCFGIKKLNGKLSFGNGHTVLIYARNGLMKTSLAKTFKCIQEGKTDEIGDVVYSKKGGAQILVDGTSIDPSQVMVVKSYEESYVSDVSQLLIDDRLKKKFECVIEVRDSLMSKLQKRSGLKIDKLVQGKHENELMDALMRDFDVQDSLILEIDKLAGYDDEYIYLGDVKYADLFNDSVINKIKVSKEFQDNVREFSRVTSDVYDEIKYFEKGSFTLPRLKNLKKDLDRESFFVKQNKIELTGGVQVDNINTLDAQIKQIESRLTSSKEYKEIAKALSGVGGTVVQGIIDNHPEIVDYLSADGLKQLRQFVWFSYFNNERELFDEFCVRCHDLGRAVSMTDISGSAWQSVVNEFNSRFHMPFKMSIENQQAVISGEATPKVAFVYEDGNERRSLSREKLDGLDVLSQGEKRALYLLNILFDIKKLESTDGQVLLVIDDIADSFDYKNKYAIVEYLYELSQKKDIYLLILSHNYDFHRTLASRLGPGRDWIYEVGIIEDGSITLSEEHYQNSPFMYWKNNKSRTRAMVIALIPFLRNMIEYGVDNGICGESDFDLLTSLLHEKENSHNITYGDLAPLYQEYLGIDISDNVNLEGKVIQDIYDLCESPQRMDSHLENKEVLAMGIRHKAEEFMISAIDNHSEKLSFSAGDQEMISSSDFLKRALNGRNQTRKLFDGYKQFGESGKVRILDEVNIMTPDYIHLNSFMYEPLIDVDVMELIDLYKKVKNLSDEA